MNVTVVGKLIQFAREPLLHFLLLGAALFALNALREAKRPAVENGPRIEVNAAVIERLKAGYERQFHRAPDGDDLKGLVTAHIREEVLYREALALGLDRDDTIVRRRLAQKMEFLTADVANAAVPDEATLQSYFARNAARYAKPARVSFRHVFLSSEKRGADSEKAAIEALSALEKGASDETLGDAFLHGFEFAEQSPDDLTALFGGEFAAKLVTLREGVWSGPVASSYGLHVVRVEARGAPRAVALAEVRDAAARDFADERRRTANAEVFDRLRERYHVAVDETALKAATAPATKTAQR